MNEGFKRGLETLLHVVGLILVLALPLYFTTELFRHFGVPTPVQLAGGQAPTQQ